MKRTIQNRSRIQGGWCRAASGALALAVSLFPMIIVTPSVQAQSFSVLHYFTGPDGAVPRGGLILDKAGNLYGATTIGGSGYGTVFKLDTAGTETVLWAFTPDNGSEPSATLLRDGAGNLYG